MIESQMVAALVDFGCMDAKHTDLAESVVRETIAERQRLEAIVDDRGIRVLTTKNEGGVEVPDMRLITPIHMQIVSALSNLLTPNCDAPIVLFRHLVSRE